MRANGFPSCRPDPLAPQPWQIQAQGELGFGPSACPALCPALLACVCWSLLLCGLFSLRALLPLGRCTCLSCACFLWSIGLGMAPVYSCLWLWFLALISSLVSVSCWDLCSHCSSQEKPSEQLLIYTHVSLTQTSAVPGL